MSRHSVADNFVIVKLRPENGEDSLRLGINVISIKLWPIVVAMKHVWRVFRLMT